MDNILNSETVRLFDRKISHPESSGLETNITTWIIGLSNLAVSGQHCFIFGLHKQMGSSLGFIQIEYYTLAQETVSVSPMNALTGLSNGTGTFILRHQHDGRCTVTPEACANTTPYIPSRLFILTSPADYISSCRSGAVSYTHFPVWSSCQWGRETKCTTAATAPWAFFFTEAATTPLSKASIKKSKTFCNTLLPCSA